MISTSSRRYAPFLSPRGKKSGSAFFFPLCFLLCLLLSSCTREPAQDSGSDFSGDLRQDIQAPQELSDQGRIVYLYLLLNDALSKGDAETAMGSIKELLYLAPTEELFREAVSIYEFSNRHAEAIDTARTGVKLYPLDLTLHMMLAEIMARSGQVDESITLLKDFSAYYGEKQTQLPKKQKQKDLSELRQLLIRLYMSDQRFKEAEDAIAALPPQERTASVLFYQAQIYKSTGREREALNKLQELVKRHPNFTEGWLALAAEAAKVKNYQDAAGYYKKALESNDMPQIFLLMLSALLDDRQVKSATQLVLKAPYPPDTKLQASLLFMEKRRFKEAKEILLSLEDSSYAPYATDEINYYLALLAYETGEDLPGALERLRDISPDAPNRERMLHLRAMLYLKNKNQEQALESAENLRDEYPENKENWLFFAELNNYAKKYAEAEVAAREALEHWPGDAGLLYTLGSSLGSRKQYDEAIAVMEEILTQDKDNSLALNYIGYTLAEQNKDLPRALLLVKKAQELEPESYQVADSVAWVYYRMGEYKKAWQAIRHCVDLGADDALVWDHYGDIAAALNKPEEAAAAYKKALRLGVENTEEVTAKMKAVQNEVRE